MDFFSVKWVSSSSDIASSIFIFAAYGDAEWDEGPRDGGRVTLVVWMILASSSLVACGVKNVGRSIPVPCHGSLVCPHNVLQDMSGLCGAVS